MKEVACPLLALVVLMELDGGSAKANAKDVRAPKKRSMGRPVVWSTKGVETWEAEDVGSSSGRARVSAMREMKRLRRRKVVDWLGEGILRNGVVRDEGENMLCDSSSSSRRDGFSR